MTLGALAGSMCLTANKAVFFTCIGRVVLAATMRTVGSDCVYAMYTGHSRGSSGKFSTLSVLLRVCGRRNDCRDFFVFCVVRAGVVPSVSLQTNYTLMVGASLRLVCTST